MSRIGNQPITVPKGVEVKIGPLMSVKGPKGQLQLPKHPLVDVEQDGDSLKCKRTGEHREARSAHGLIRALMANMVKGVSDGFERRLEINGVGYRAEVKGKSINLLLGFSHPVDFPLPEGITAKVEKNIIILSGIDKALLGQTAANIRSLRPPEPYKGKGVKYVEERIIRKAGKSAS